ncbi:hypothetical protein PVAP13_1KG338705 [Panicum virgatum]|uniref:Secreted protein n=1 Tax=Panicum virgatum TaxID=38727 RepID=A0A8T0XPG5_PANVG|nr:hypothetical protein PVAP13_1KG338705 [Panicum virgatum]
MVWVAARLGVEASAGATPLLLLPGAAAQQGVCVREQLGAAQAAPRAATTGSARAATRRPAQRGGQHWCRTPPPGAKCGGAAWRARAQGSCPPNWEREQKLAGDPSLPSSSHSCCYSRGAKVVAFPRPTGRGRRLTRGRQRPSPSDFVSKITINQQ